MVIDDDLYKFQEVKNKVKMLIGEKLDKNNILKCFDGYSQRNITQAILGDVDGMGIHFIANINTIMANEINIIVDEKQMIIDVF